MFGMLCNLLFQYLKLIINNFHIFFSFAWYVCVSICMFQYFIIVYKFNILDIKKFYGLMNYYD